MMMMVMMRTATRYLVIELDERKIFAGLTTCPRPPPPAKIFLDMNADARSVSSSGSNLRVSFLVIFLFIEVPAMFMQRIPDLF